MPRPKKNRVIQGLPSSVSFLPEGENPEGQEENAVILSLDELEAIRLADLEGLYQQHAAEHMHVSRQTFGNILNGARKKIAECLILGKGLHIEGGHVQVEARHFRCNHCRYSWREKVGTGGPRECPECHSREIQKNPEDSSCCGGHRKRGFRQRERTSPSPE